MREQIDVLEVREDRRSTARRQCDVHRAPPARSPRAAGRLQQVCLAGAGGAPQPERVARRRREAARVLDGGGVGARDERLEARVVVERERER